MEAVGEKRQSFASLAEAARKQSPWFLRLLGFGSIPWPSSSFSGRRVRADLRNPLELEQSLRAIPGVVGTGLFLGMAHAVLVDDNGRIEVKQSPIITTHMPVIVVVQIKEKRRCNWA